MSKRVLLVSIALLLIGGAVIAALGQEEGAQKFNLLIVDETRTFGSSIRVEVLARVLLKTGLFELSAKIVEVPSSFADPLQGLEPDKRYDLILVVPQGIDDGTVKQIWVATRPFPELDEELRGAVGTVKEIANGIFRGAATAVGVTDDLIPGYFAAIFIREGWL
ncbi:MAG: hypothetical protein ACE5KR_04745 [Candidatus Bipolaricaulia bacterium]